jgi:protein-disulfide isomerase
MPSGKKSKQARRAPQVKPPPVRAKGAPRARQASPRVLAIGGGIVVAVVAAVVAAFALTGGNGSSVGTLPTSGTLANGLPGASEVNALLNGIQQRGLTLGSPNAPVTLVEYIDLQCPYCQRFETQVMPDLVRRYVRTGKVRLEARVLDFIGPDSSRGRNAMIAASMQDKAFNFAQLLYDNQRTENTGWLNDAMVAAAAKSIPGVNPRQLFAVRNTSAVKNQGISFDHQASSDRITGTPTLFVGKSGTHRNQVALASPTDEQAVVQAIKVALTS